METIKQDYANLPYPLKGFVHQTAFVRHNSERKLDVARFRAMFEDIASIQYPDLFKKVRLCS